MSSVLPPWRTVLTDPAFLARRALARRLETLLGLSVRPGQTWLDVGCGLRPYESLFAEARYVGVDVASSGREAALKAPDVVYDGRALPFEARSVDGVLSTQVLEHVPEPGALVAEFARVLKSGGAVVASLPFFWCQHEKPYDFHRFTEFAARRLFEEAGFSVERLEKSSGAAETLAQAAATYLSGEVIARLPFGRSLFVAALCAPVQLAGAAAQRLLPDAGDLFLDNVVLARKR